MASSIPVSVTESPRPDRLEHLEQHPRRDLLLQAAWRAAGAAIDLGNRHFPDQPSPAEFDLEPADAITAAGNAAVILREGAQTPQQREFVADLVLLAAARDFPSAPETELETARRLVWLETHTSVRVLDALILRLGDDAGALGAALVRALQPDGGNDEREPPLPPRGEVLVIAAALAALPPAVASRLPPPPSALLEDDAAARQLEGVGSTEVLPGAYLEGELGPPPRSAWQTVLLAMTLWLFASHLLRLLGRAVLGYRTPTRARVSGRGLELEARTLLLGRTLRSRNYFVPLDQLASVEREIRFARGGLYAGLVSLALGTYVGAGLLVDGLRAPGGSAALIGWALLCIALGALADFALTSFSDSRRGRCRLIVRPRRGRRFAVRKLDPSLVDAMLHRLAAARQAPAETAPAA